MKKIIIVSLFAGLGFVGSAAPSYANMHCYIINGKQTCCVTTGNITSCF